MVEATASTDPLHSLFADISLSTLSELPNQATLSLGITWYLRKVRTSGVTQGTGRRQFANSPEVSSSVISQGFSQVHLHTPLYTPYSNKSSALPPCSGNCAFIALVSSSQRRKAHQQIVKTLRPRTEQDIKCKTTLRQKEKPPPKAGGLFCLASRLSRQSSFRRTSVPETCPPALPPFSFAEASSEYVRTG